MSETLKFNGWHRLWILLTALYALVIGGLVVVDMPTRDKIIRSWANAAIYARLEDNSRRLGIDSVDQRIEWLREYRRLPAERIVKDWTEAARRQLAEHSARPPGPDYSGVGTLVYDPSSVWKDLLSLEEKFSRELDGRHRVQREYIANGLWIWLLPSFAVLAFGYAVSWVYRGFRPTDAAADRERTIPLHPDTYGKTESESGNADRAQSDSSGQPPVLANQVALGGLHPWRRFLARFVDMSILGLLPALLLVLLLSSIERTSFIALRPLLENPIVVGVILLMMWVPIESLLLARTGTTPAKWLFGIVVRTSNGGRLTLNEAFLRTCGVVVQGLGLGIPFVSMFTYMFAYKRLKRTGTTLWDKASGTTVFHLDWGIARVISCGVAVAVFVAFTVLLAVAFKS